LKTRCQGEFGLAIKLVKLIKMCLNENYCEVCIGKILLDVFPIQNGLKEGDVLSPLFFNFAENIPPERSKKIRKDWK
jgi:hypothetical protein